MKTLLIGNGLEILFNQEMALKEIKAKGLDAIDHLDNEKLEKFLVKFFAKDQLFNEKQAILLEHYPLIFKKLIAPILIQKTNHSSFEQHLDEISWKIKPFLAENKIGVNANVLEVFIKHLVLFYFDQQWSVTSEKLTQFLQIQEIKNYFNQFDVFLTTNYTPILELINSQLEFPLPEERLINLYGKFEANETDSYNDVSLLWQGKRKNLVDVWKTLKTFEISQLEIVGFNFYDNKILLNKILAILQVQQGSSNQINYLGYEKNDLDQFYQLLVDNQIKTEIKLNEYTTFKQKERNGELTVLKNQKENIENYGYVIGHDRYSVMNNLTLTRKSATIVKTEFYYNLSKYFEDGYTIENKNLLVETTNQYDNGHDLTINFLDFENYFCGAYNQTFKDYFKLVSNQNDSQVNEKGSNKLGSIEQVQIIEKGPLVVSYELVPVQKPNYWMAFLNKTKMFFNKWFKPRKSENK